MILPWLMAAWFLLLFGLYLCVFHSYLVMQTFHNPLLTILFMYLTFGVLFLLWFMALCFFLLALQQEGKRSMLALISFL